MKIRQLSRLLFAAAALSALLVLTLGLAVAVGWAQSTAPGAVYAELTYLPRALHQGQPALGMLVIPNESDQPVTLDALSIELAEGLTYVGQAIDSDITTPAQLDGSTLRWTGPFELAAGETLTLHYWIVATDAAPGLYPTQTAISLAGKILESEASPLEISPAPDTPVVQTGPSLNPAAAPEAAPEAISDVTATKTAIPASILPRNGAIFEVVFDNSGNSAQALDTIIDTLPAPFEYIGLAYGSDVHAEPIDKQAPEIVWQGNFVVPGNGTLTLRYWVWVPIDTEARLTPYVNTVIASFGSASIEPATGAVVVRGPNIEVTKDVWPQEVLVAEVVTYTVTLENNGNDAGVIDLISDTLPLGFEFAGMSSGGSIITPPTGIAGTIFWDGPIAMPIGAQKTLIYRAKTSMASGLESPVNQVVAVYGGKHSTPGTAAVTVNPRLVYLPLTFRNYTPPYFVSAKSVTPNQVEVADAAQEVVYTVEFTNPGDDPALLDTVTDTLPIEFTFVGMESGSDVGAPDDPLANPLVWSGPFPQTGPGETLTLKYRVRVEQDTEPGTYDNSVTASTLIGRPPSEPGVASVDVKEPFLLVEDFESGTDGWEPFLNYWRLEPEQWYLEGGKGRDGSTGLRHSAFLGKTDPERGAHDALYMWRGEGSEEWTDYRMETWVRMDEGSYIGLWVRGKYFLDEDDGKHVEGYYIIWRANRDKDAIKLQRLRTSGGTAYHFSDPIDLAADTGTMFKRTWYKMAVEVRGSNIKVFVNNELRIDHDDDTFSEGTVGFICYEVDYGTWDNVLVTPLD